MNHQNKKRTRKGRDLQPVELALSTTIRGITTNGKQSMLAGSALPIARRQGAHLVEVEGRTELELVTGVVQLMLEPSGRRSYALRPGHAGPTPEHLKDQAHGPGGVSGWFITPLKGVMGEVGAAKPPRVMAYPQAELIRGMKTTHPANVRFGVADHGLAMLAVEDPTGPIAVRVEDGGVRNMRLIGRLPAAVSPRGHGFRDFADPVTGKPIPVNQASLREAAFRYLPEDGVLWLVALARDGRPAPSVWGTLPIGVEVVKANTATAIMRMDGDLPMAAAQLVQAARKFGHRDRYRDGVPVATASFEDASSNPMSLLDLAAFDPDAAPEARADGAPLPATQEGETSSPALQWAGEEVDEETGEAIGDDGLTDSERAEQEARFSDL